MLIFLPVMLFPNAPNDVRLCFRNIPVALDIFHYSSFYPTFLENQFLAACFGMLRNRVHVPAETFSISLGNSRTRFLGSTLLESEATVALH